MIFNTVTYFFTKDGLNNLSNLLDCKNTKNFSYDNICVHNL